MNEKLLMICEEISDMFVDNELTYSEVLTIIYVLKEVTEKEVETGVKDMIESTIKEFVGVVKWNKNY